MVSPSVCSPLGGWFHRQTVSLGSGWDRVGDTAPPGGRTVCVPGRAGAAPFPGARPAWGWGRGGLFVRFCLAVGGGVAAGGQPDEAERKAGTAGTQLEAAVTTEFQPAAKISVRCRERPAPTPGSVFPAQGPAEALSPDHGTRENGPGYTEAVVAKVLGAPGWLGRWGA